MKLLVACLVLTFGAICFAATTGVDVSQPTTIETFQCLVNDGHTFAVARAYQSSGKADKNCAKIVSNAWTAGFAQVDLYMFPCPLCPKSAEDQVAEMMKMIADNEVMFQTMWLDIEGPEYWGKNVSKNRQFFDDLLAASVSYGLNIGIYTSLSQWQPIMGLTWDHGGEYPLWYARYDGKADYNDFKPFGGWTFPTIKQYLGDVKKCNQNIDVNWSESNY